MSVLSQLILLPVTVFVYGLDFMVRTLQGMQQAAQQIANPNAGPPPPAGAGLARFNPIGGGAATTFKEAREMSNDCCSDNGQCGKPFCEVRVYEYYIVSVKPCEEKLLQGTQSAVITTDMSGEAFSSLAIARFVRENPNFPERDFKYLRCCYKIQCTLPKERETCMAQDQVQVLREIRDALLGGPPSEAASAAAG